MLSLIIFLPLVGGIIILFTSKTNETLLKGVALGASLASFVLSLFMTALFKIGGGFQFVELGNWIPSLGIHYHLGVDGLSLPLIVLTALLSLLSVAYSWRMELRLKEYLFLFLLLETGMLGVFAALDFFLFYIFWEITLVPMYFLIGIWGGPRREYAAIKFFLYTLVGSLAMLLAILVMYFNAQPHTFNMLTLIEQQPLAAKPVLAALAFWGFFLSFAIKVPMWPFHTWLPDAHVEAPTAGSVILAGVLLKMGTYGFLRFCLPLFPDASVRFTPWMFALAVIGIIYGAWVSMVQPDIKKLVAYSSVSHLGFVVLGIFTLTPPGLVGGIIQMVNHGLSTGALFLMVGMIYERRHTRLIADFGGLWSVVPAFSALFMVVVLSSLGLPGLNGFVGEFLVLVGAFQTSPWLAAVATSGIVFAAVYLLGMYQREDRREDDAARG